MSNETTSTDATPAPESTVERLRPDRTAAEHELAESEAPAGETASAERLRPSRESAD